VKTRAVVHIDETYFEEGCKEYVPSDPPEFYRWWLDQPNDFFIEGGANIKEIIKDCLGPENEKRLAERGRRAAEGKVLAFRAWEADFGHPPNWRLNPVTGKLWPEGIHSKRLLTPATKKNYGDIKLTWEIGRFLHVSDIVRAYYVCNGEDLIKGLFEQIASFEKDNPLFEGPHWVSEQEVGIRACMLAFVLYSLRGSGCLNGSRVRLILRQLAGCADYCDREIGLAKWCINNNHLIAGALGMYLPGCLMPWHKRAQTWKHRGRQILLECLKSQWYADGGYIQPSHNYHRLALSYLLWVLRLAEKQRDSEMTLEVRKCFSKAFEILNSMIDEATGMVPNWGANDGAYFPPWNGSDYADFRPLLSSLRFALSGTRQYGKGPWDEQLFWLWGPENLSCPVDYSPPVERSYPQAGLHPLRQKVGLAVFRCGPVLSRYGQQADQLHVDIWWRGKNVVLDAGSYLYEDELYHEWFRSTDAHNTVVVDGLSQMTPYRQFLFLRWPNAWVLSSPPPPSEVRAWYLGWHDGYMRLAQKIQHWRVLAELNDRRWLVLDYLKSCRAGKPVKISQRWHFCSCKTNTYDNKVELILDVGNFGVMWAGTSQISTSLSIGDSLAPDGWYSRYYGIKEASPSLHISCELKKEAIIGNLLGPIDALQDLRVDGCQKEIVFEEKKVSFKDFDFMRQ
jgi:asparagine synthase (glutamine-hydrolysing)